jgi:predicted nucleic acid-binding protein
VAFKSLAENQRLSNAIVVDNSVMMRWLFQDGSESDQQYAQQVLTQIEAHKPQVIVPYIWVYEASFVVNYYAKKDSLSYATSINHLDSLFDLCAVIRGEEPPSKLFDFANTHRLSSYDAAYIQLAVQQCCPIATLDKAMIGVTERLNISLVS